MSNNIINLLNDINILQDRKNNIDGLLKLINVPQFKTIPMLELYEYELKGYPTDNTGTKFTTIFATPIKKCGIIVANKYSEYDSEYKSSCDSISSDPDKNENNGNSIGSQIYYNILAKSYEQLKTKDGKHIYDSVEEIARINNEIKTLTKYINKNLLDNTLDMGDNKKLHNGALIYHIKVDNNEKIIVIGDLHGSFHTFWRHIKRFVLLEILTVDLVLNNNYRIIFLGDILDRGQHAHDILHYILLLMSKNNREDKLKIIYNRGNHEDLNTYNYGGFIGELAEKGFNIENIKGTYYKFFGLLSSAIILESDNSKIWLSHGGFPMEFTISNGKVNPNIIDFSIQLERLKENGILYFNNEIKNLKDENGLLSQDFNKDICYTDIPLQIKWNDFGICPKNNLFKINNRGEGIYVISPDLSQIFCKGNNFDYIIRGHQDHPYNSYIVSEKNENLHYTNIKHKGTRYYNVPNDVYPIGHSNISDTYKNDEYIYINKNYVDNERGEKRLAVNGPIARIHMTNEIHENNKTKFYPVITLSSNTDIDRNLTHDSYGILRFDKNNLDFVE